MAPTAENTYLSAWQGDLADAHARWELQGRGQTVAVIDSGIAYDHPALGGGLGAGYRVVGGWDFTAENDADPYDDPPAGFHGTHVAGILASRDKTHPGVAPQVDLVALRVFDDQGRSDFRWIEKALRWVEEHRTAFPHPITTVNLSLGVAPADTGVSGNILADEFARLAAAGIFVAVAAGNGYQSDGQSALNYPASDPSVVPVGSADSQGRLSHFTRRDPRMLVAPGERITSTITDYLYDFNGKTDDFRAFSGTSQATPQVAGAAVLIREAFQRAGRPEVGQREILDVMRRSSETLVDPATGLAYHRIRLGAALELVLPDREPSRPEQAIALSVANAPAAITGRLDRPGDQDFFTFPSLRRGLLRVDVRSAPTQSRLRIHVEGTEVDWTQTPGFEVHPGQRVLVHVEGEIAGDYSWAIDVDPFESLGPVAFAERNTSVTNGGNFRLETVTEGWLTLAAPTIGPGETRLQLRDSRHRLVLDVRPQSGADRWDVRVHAGEVYWVRLVDAPPAGSRLVVANVVTQDEQGGWSVDVPTGIGQLDVRLDASLQMAWDGRDVPLPKAAARSLVIRQNPGSKLVLESLRRGDSFAVRDDRVEASNGRYRLSIVHPRQLHLQGLAGLGQRVQLLGSLGPDRYEADGGVREFSNATTRTRVSGVDRVYFHGGGGDDVAVLRGSVQNDVLLAREGWTRLVTPGFLDEVDAVARVEVDARGGQDRASLSGTSADDTLVVRPTEATLSSYLRTRLVRGFEKVQAAAGSGGSDRALLHGSRGDDWLVATQDSARLGTDGFLAVATDFDRVFAYGDGGWDSARLYGSDVDDWLRLQTRMVTVGGPSGVRAAVDFDDVFTDAGNQGLDTVFAPAAVRAALPSDWSGEWLRLAALGIRWSSTGFDRWQVQE